MSESITATLNSPVERVTAVIYDVGEQITVIFSEAPRGPAGVSPEPSITAAYTTSETAPSDTDLPWFDPSDGTWSVWNGNAWVVTSGPSGATEDPEEPAPSDEIHN